MLLRGKVKTSIPVVHHQLLHTQQSVVADELVLVVHVVHYQLFSTQLLNNPKRSRVGKKYINKPTTK